MAVRSGGQAPYAPPQTVLQLIHQFRNRALPTPFTKDVLTRAGVPDSLVPRVLQTFRLLDLIDESGNPTREFEGLRRAAEAEYPQRLGDIVRAAYADVIQFVDPATDPPERVRDVFRHYEPLGQLARMVTLFLGLCSAAGIIPEESRRAAPAPSSRPPRSSSPSRKATARGMERQQPTERHPVSGGTIPPAIAGLLAVLPANGTGWTRTQRDKFMDTFKAVLDFSVPIREDVGLATDDAEDGS